MIIGVMIGIALVTAFSTTSLIPQVQQALAQEEEREEGITFSANQDQKQQQDITAYNQDLGFITDTRTLYLSNGLNSVRFEDIAV